MYAGVIKIIMLHTNAYMYSPWCIVAHAPTKFCFLSLSSFYVSAKVQDAMYSVNQKQCEP